VTRYRITTTARITVEADPKEGMTLAEAITSSRADLVEILAEEGLVTGGFIANGVDLTVDVYATGAEMTP